MRFNCLILLMPFFNSMVYGQELDSWFIENGPFIYVQIDCLPININKLEKCIVKAKCPNQSKAKGTYINGEKRQVYVESEDYYINLNYLDGVFNGQQCVFSKRDTHQVLIVNYSKGLKHGWSVLKQLFPGDSSIIFGFDFQDSVITNLTYSTEAVPLELETNYKDMTFGVIFYRTGMPFVLGIRKGQDFILVAEYYESGMTKRINEGLISGQKLYVYNTFLSLTLADLADSTYLIKGSHTEYDEKGNILVYEQKYN